MPSSALMDSGDMEEGDNLHPRMASLKPLGLVGHRHIIDQMTSCDQRSRRHHGYIFQGPKGVGKATTAYTLAEALFCSHSPDDPDMALLRAGTHPDMMVISPDPEKTTISVEQIRTIIPFLAHTPARKKNRFVLIDALDATNINGSNALLKTLEEPPDNTIIIIVSHGSTPVLPTIRSRVQMVKFNPLNLDQTSDVIRTLFPDADPSWINAAAILAEGAPGKAIMLADAQVPDLYTETCNALAQQKISDLKIDELAAKWGANGAKNANRRFLARLFFDRLISHAAKNAINAQLGDDTPQTHEEQLAIQNLATHLTPLQLAEIRQKLLSELYHVEHLNLDTAPSIFNALKSLARH